MSDIRKVIREVIEKLLEEEVLFLRWTTDPLEDIKRNFSGHLQAWFDTEEEALEDIEAQYGENSDIKPKYDPINQMWNSDPEWGLSGYGLKDEQGFNLAMESIREISWFHKEDRQQDLAVFKSKNFQNGTGFDGEDLFKDAIFIGFLEDTSTYDDFLKLIKNK